MAKVRTIAVGRLASALAGVTVGLASIVAVEVFTGVRLPVPDAQVMIHKGDFSPAPLVARSIPPVSTFDSVSARSLFVPGRGGVTVAPQETAVGTPAPEQTADPQLDATLLAVVVRGHQKVAVLRFEPSQEATATTVGQTIGEWTLVAIGLDSVELRHESSSKVLYLSDDDTRLWQDR